MQRKRALTIKLKLLLTEAKKLRLASYECETESRMERRQGVVLCRRYIAIKYPIKIDIIWQV